MRAANTAAGAAATQPAGKPRLKRAMKAHLVKLWNAVAAAGPEGITVDALTELLPDSKSKQHSTALSYLRTLDYVATSGGRQKGARWWATGVPVACVAPDWMREVEMPRRPTSVFALAAAPVPTDWTLRGRRTPPPRDAQLRDEDDDEQPEGGVDIDLVHGNATSKAAPSPLGWVAPPAEQCKPHTPPSTHTPPPPYLPAEKDPPHDPLYAPHFALHSDGTFEIHVDASLDGIVLQPDTTRALFRWLDRLGGTHLSRIAEGA